MKSELKNAFESEMAAAHLYYQKEQLHQAFKHLERAHVLGQRYVVPHTQTHWLMLKIGWQRRSALEVFGQSVRIVLGIIASAIKTVPAGNTGGTDISMFKRLPIDPAISTILDRN